MKRLLIHYSIAGLVAYLGLCGWLYAAQGKLLYFPTPEVTAMAAESMTLRNGSESLKVWKVGDGSNAVIYFGGNGEDVARNIDNVSGLLPDTSAYLLNYRGYGGSSGTPSEAAIMEDAVLLYDDVARRHPQVAVIGRSLGSGVATWVASQRDAWKVVLVTPYDSIEDVAKKEYPFAPVSLLLRDKYRSIDNVPGIRAPVLVLLADIDNVIPRAHSMNLIGSFPIEQVTVRVLPDTTHNTIGSAADYFLLIRQFLVEEAADTAAQRAASGAGR